MVEGSRDRSTGPIDRAIDGEHGVVELLPEGVDVGGPVVNSRFIRLHLQRPLHPVLGGRELVDGESISGSNMFFRRDLLRRVGGFDPELGMQGRGDR